jgi:hypothetical protein
MAAGDAAKLKRGSSALAGRERLSLAEVYEALR